MAWPENYNSSQSPQSVVVVSGTTGLPTTPSVGNADGSQDIGGVNGTSVATAANPVPTRDYGSATIATSQVNVGTASTQIVPARSGRLAVTITMVGAGDIFVGVTGVTAANGALLLGVKGSSITIPTQAAVFGIGAVAQQVSVLETF